MEDTGSDFQFRICAKAWVSFIKIKHEINKNIFIIKTSEVLNFHF